MNKKTIAILLAAVLGTAVFALTPNGNDIVCRMHIGV